MGKKAIVSKHIVLSGDHHLYSHHPMYGIILIEGEFIFDVIILDDNVPVNAVIEKYSEWSPQDYANFYISPGIIDLNVRREFENYTFLTKSAVSGGVSLIIEEDGFYTADFQNGDLYCDIGKILVLDKNNFERLEEIQSKEYLAVKSYLFPPSTSVQTVPSDLAVFFDRVSELKLPVFIDPTLPDARMLFMASPMRFEKVEERNTAEKSENYNVFAAAFPDTIDSEDDSESSQSIPDLEVTRSFWNEDLEKLQHQMIKSRSNSGENFECLQIHKEIQKEISPVNDSDEYSLLIYSSKSPHLRSKTHTIFDDLDKRIKQNQVSIENISQAEQFTYKQAGRTEFRRQSFPFAGNTIPIMEMPKTQAEPVKNTYEDRMKFRRPQALSIKPQQEKHEDKKRIYVYHLANYSEHWETSGIEKILASLRPEIPLHIVGISSAIAINKIRQAKEHFPRLTCEIPAPHLYFTCDSVKDGSTIFKNSPPIRNRGNCNLLWDLLKMKAIDCISSQHAFISPRCKDIENGNFHKALNGICSIGFTLQAIWTMLNVPVSTQSQLEHYIIRISKWLSLYPARILNIQDKRGSIEKGKYCDLVIWSPYERIKINEIYSENEEISPFLGQEMHGKIHKVYVRGKVAYDEKEFFIHGKQMLSG
ncbi:unnamed protein product [Blepharisma stoltei]|uniref:Amidohydrolase-related domain-containing protein n=1 Tax=Blepharisma stoltei TaxID=1481888 RepID=A0AAU9IZS1_9CILI|nr:unnamed protein product [Blepharisma stoltei]